MRSSGAPQKRDSLLQKHHDWGTLGWENLVNIAELYPRYKSQMRLTFFSLIFLLIGCAGSLGATIGNNSKGVTRNYYIAAEDVTWDYAPSGRDLIHGLAIPPPWSSKTQWSKTRFIEYTDDTFSVRKPQPPWLGILGPIIRAEVGDTIVVHFLNRSQVAHSIHPHGLRYDKQNEGALYLPAGSGATVPPTGKFTYTWAVDETSGPGPGDPSSVVWWYHPHVEAEKEINSGLMGPIIITRRGAAKPDATPKDVDQEFVASFMIFDELKGADPGLFHAINGYIFGNLPGLVMKKSERVRWHLLGMGNEKDLHTPHWHGLTVLHGQHRTDVIELLPASMVTVDMIADNPGTWMFHCHVSDHMEAGMMVTFTVYDPPPSCPIQFLSGDFWNESGIFTLHVKNTGSKTIQTLAVMSRYFLSALDLRPAFGRWALESPLRPGQEQTLQLENNLRDTQTILGWAVFPQIVVYEDGSKWQNPEGDECFQVYWRDPEHPDYRVLPPTQYEQQED
jgi:Multicopper oxidase